jgi:hypothetical protein
MIAETWKNWSSTSRKGENVMEMIENYKVSVTKMPYGRQIRKYCALFGVALLKCNLLIPLPKAIS